MISKELLEEAVKTANKLGHEGVRVVSVQWIPPRSLIDDCNGYLQWYCDNGPKSLTESW